MLLLRMHQMIEKEFSRKLPIVTLLQHPTIRTLAAHLGGAVGTPGATRPADAAAERARKQREALARQRTKVRPG